MEVFIKPRFLKLVSSAELNWQEGFTATVFSTLDRLDPSAWFSDWPGSQPVQGEIGFSLLQRQLVIRGFKLQ